MRLLRGFVLCLVLGSVGPAPAQSPTGFRFWKMLDRPASQDEEIVGFDLDSDIYAATRAAFPDLRVLDGTGAEAPYHIVSLVKSHEERTHEPFGTQIVSLREDGGAIVVRLRLPQNSAAADGFSLVTPLTDYERHVRAFGSADGSEWTPLAEGFIFDYSRYMDVSSRDIAVPENSCREFQLVIEEVVDEKGSPYTELTRTFRAGKEEQRVERTTVQQRAFRIDRIDAWHEVTRRRVEKPETVVYPIAGFEAREDAEKKQTILHVRMRREPLRSFTLETKSRNFYRRAVVQVPVVQGVQTQWQPIGEATVFNFSFRSQHREQLAVVFPEQRQEEYRLVIQNEDNPPLDITGVKAEGSIWRVVFLGQPAEKYRVFYASETAESPKYEAGVLFASLGHDYQPLAAKLGPQRENEEFGGEPFALRKLLNNWIFLGSVIGLMVIVLGWSLFRAARHLEEPPADQEPMRK
jgi:hypothetical protein